MSSFPKLYERTDATLGTETDPTSLAIGPASAGYVKNDNVWSAAAGNAADGLGYGFSRPRPKQLAIAVNAPATSTTYKVTVWAYDAGLEKWLVALPTSASKAYGLIVALAVPILGDGVYAFGVVSDDGPVKVGKYSILLGYDWASS